MAGALHNSERGVWVLTDKGRGVTRDEVADIARQVRTEIRRKRKRRNSVGADRAPESEEEEHEDSWQDRALGAALAAPPDAFERLAQRLLREANFASVKMTGRSGDGGIDGVGVYGLSLVGFSVFFQCKRYKGSVGASTGALWSSRQ